MPAIALALFVFGAVVGLGWRCWLMRRRTGSAGFRGISGRPGSAEWFGGVGFVLALALGVAAPVLRLFGVVTPLSFLHVTWIQVAGIVLAVIAFALLFLSIELQVRLVEEPYLLGAHGDAYRGYTARVGRFLPGLGRIR